MESWLTLSWKLLWWRADRKMRARVANCGIQKSVFCSCKRVGDRRRRRDMVFCLCATFYILVLMIYWSLRDIITSSGHHYLFLLNFVTIARFVPLLVEILYIGLCTIAYESQMFCNIIAHIRNRFVLSLDSWVYEQIFFDYLWITLYFFLCTLLVVTNYCETRSIVVQIERALAPVFSFM